jgi:GTP-binding protein
MTSIAIIGRPNVGKSSLFNSLTRSRKAIVSDFEGLTRDRQSKIVNIYDKTYELVDSGGLNFLNKNLIFNKDIIEQSVLAVDEADLILFMVDFKAGMVDDDIQISSMLRKRNKLLCLVINKVDGVDDEIAKSEFYKLGFSDIICTSITHNYGIDNLKDFISHKLSNESEKIIQPINQFKIAIIGKPNAGKSTFINSVIGNNRLISSDIPGTTVDSIEIEFEYGDNNFILIDTAGIRRKGKVTNKEEKYAILMSLENAKEANFIFIVVDATVGITAQDQALVTEALEIHKPLILLFNKWDLLNQYEKDRFDAAYDKFKANFSFIECLKISAEKKTNLSKVFKKLVEVKNLLQKEFKTSMLNNLLSDAIINHPPSISKGIRPKIKFVSFVSRSPLAFKLQGNHLANLTGTYERYLEKFFRQALDLRSIPIKLIFENSENPYAYKSKKIKTGLVTRRKIKNKLREKMTKKS